MNPVAVIKKKRNGDVLSEKEIEAFIHGYLDKNIPDYQMSAFLMTIYFQGMTISETSALVKAMLLDSEKGMDLSGVSAVKISKHSTGGVGDKLSLILAPLLASQKMAMAKISGRGLGHTGGTIDKLESIPGFQTSLSKERFEQIVAQVGAAIISTDRDLCPADKKIYALRDVTGTVGSIPLIVSSIMSKKLSENFDGLVLDVKMGEGAFVKNLKEAKVLSQYLLAVGKKWGKEVRVLITDMSQPLGRWIGNALEVNECISLMCPSMGNDDIDPQLYEATMAVGSEMYCLGKKLQTGDEIGVKEARTRLEESLRSGEVWNTFLKMVEAQGGDTNALIKGELPAAPYRFPVKAKKSGVICRIHTEQLGMALIELGGGRKKMGEKIDHGVGFRMDCKMGSKVSAEDVLLEVYARTEEVGEKVATKMETLIEIGEGPVKPPPLIWESMK